MKPSKAGEPETKHEKAIELWFKMRKFQFKRDDTKEQNNHASELLASLTTSSSELLGPQSLTPKAYTSSDVLRAEIFLAMNHISRLGNCT